MKGLRHAVLALLGAIMIGIGAAYWMVRGSLPILDGELTAEFLIADVSVERDKYGMVTVNAENRHDAGFALGFIHAQERFFQMDLLRRASAGELSALLGTATVDYDKKIRVHRLRKRASLILNQLEPYEKKQLRAYVEGVNYGLTSLLEVPFEYLLLQQEPESWKPEDTILAVYSMYLQLQPSDGEQERSLAVMRDELTPEQFEFLVPMQTEWDSPLMPHRAHEVAKIPEEAPPQPLLSESTALKPLKALEEHLTPGSNNWAVSGERTHDGRAIIADDMHLRIRVPNTWFKASLRFAHETGDRVVTGLTLPGTPAMVVGSNGYVAWGYTNSYGDFHDVIQLEVNENSSQYKSPSGMKSFDEIKEVIHIAGAEPQIHIVKETQWGPVIGHDHQGNLLAYRWVIHDPEAVNFGLLQLELTKTLDEAVAQANKTSIPTQNMVLADNQGQIAWTLIGPVPKRMGYSGRWPTSWADGKRYWDGYHQPENYPRIINPSQGYVFSANSRVVSQEWDQFLGTGRYALGARAWQIKDKLNRERNMTEEDLLAIQLDDEAVLMSRWQILVSDLLRKHKEGLSSQQEAFYDVIKRWQNRASIDSADYRLIRAFRKSVTNHLLEYHLASLRVRHPEFDYYAASRQFESSVWRMLESKPEAWLPKGFKNWDEYLLSRVESVAKELSQAGSLELRVWGEQNQAKIEHPLTAGMKLLSPLLNPRVYPMSGDRDITKVHDGNFGQSERLVVSPGKEEDGILQLPTGQSGHPLSPFYLADHEAWVTGEKVPFLPGETKFTLHLKAL